MKWHDYRYEIKNYEQLHANKFDYKWKNKMTKMGQEEREKINN